MILSHGFFIFPCSAAPGGCSYREDRGDIARRVVTGIMMSLSEEAEALNGTVRPCKDHLLYRLVLPSSAFGPLVMRCCEVRVWGYFGVRVFDPPPEAFFLRKPAFVKLAILSKELLYTFKALSTKSAEAMIEPKNSKDGLMVPP